MLAGPIAGIIEHRRWRCRSAEWGIVPDVCPDPTRIGLASCKNRHCRIIAMNPFGCKGMCLDPPQQRVQDMAAGTDGISHCRQADRHPFQREALDLTIEGNVLAELVAQDHRQKARACPASGDDVEGGWRLADFLAVTAGELFADRLNDLPGAWNALHRLGDVFTQLAQPRTAAAGTGDRTRHNDTLARQVIGKGFLDGPFACEAGDVDGSGRCNGHFGGKLVLGRRLGVLKHQLHLRNQPRGPFRLLATQLSLKLFDMDLLPQNGGLIVRFLGFGDGKLG